MLNNQLEIIDQMIGDAHSSIKNEGSVLSLENFTATERSLRGDNELQESLNTDAKSS